MRRILALAAIAAVAAVACRRRSPGVNPGDAVTVRYELSVDGAVRESVMQGAPVELIQGDGTLPPGADAALLGMSAGEEKRVELPPARAFGERDPKLVEPTPLKDLGAVGTGLRAGQKVHGFRDGVAQTASVLAVKDGVAELDFNHELAGKSVVYRLRVDAFGPRPR